MPLIYITGITGTGKSAVMRELQKRGYEVHGIDEDKIAGWYNNKTGKLEDLREPDERTEEWRSQVIYKVARERVEDIVQKAVNKPVFLCGVAENDTELWDLFSKVFALSVDEPTLHHRITTRTNNDFGKLPHELKGILEWNKTGEQEYKKRGAIIVDATQPVDEIIGIAENQTTNNPRCAWAKGNDLMIAYHDQEWGVPVHDDQQLFEMLNLEGAQAGLSWQTILARRDNYRRAFDNFDAKKIAEYDDTKRATLLQDAGIIRNRLKVNAFIENAKATLAMQQKHGSLDVYLWGFVGDHKLTEANHDQADQISKYMSKQLKKDGFRFVGPTTCYAFMQAVGMINDHEPECFRYGEI